MLKITQFTLILITIITACLNYSLEEAPKDSQVKNNDYERLTSPNLLTEERKMILQQCVWLKAILGSKRLRETITSIHNAPNRQVKLKSARSNPEFEEFVQKMLNEINFSI
jgi:hypothetical protein